MEIDTERSLRNAGDFRRPGAEPAARTRLAVLATHPIQYYAPWFRYLAQQLDLEVLYAHKQDSAGQAAAGFGVSFDWDVPLLEGYRYRWLNNVSRNPGLRVFSGCDTPELFDLIRPENYDALLVLGRNRKSYIQGIQAAWRHRVPLLSRGDSHLMTRRSWGRRLLKFVPYRLLLPRIDAYLYVGARNRAYLRHYGVQDHQLFFCPHFVDNNFFAKGAEEARASGRALEIRQQFGIPADACVGLFVGKFLPKKRAGDFVAASLRAALSRPDYHALLVGEGPLRREIELLGSENPGRVHFAGFRNQSAIPAFYAAADVLVLPSDEETWGLVVNEAMASGLPAIVSYDVGCAPDLVENDITGWTFPTGDITALANLLIQFRARTREALQRKCETYSLERATIGLEQSLNAVCACRKPLSPKSDQRIKMPPSST